MATVIEKPLFQAGDYSVVRTEDGFFALLHRGEWEDGVDTLKEAIAYAQGRHFDETSEKLFDLVNGLKPEDPASVRKVEAAIRALAAKPTGE